MDATDLFSDDVQDRKDLTRSEDDPALIVDVDGFEGPLDLLLELARRHKVDLHRISILNLADQYIAFVEAARTIRLELAADYLVMGAWLAYLKSRLLLPKDETKPDEPSAEELAGALANRLRSLQAIRRAAELLMARPQLGRDVFGVGQPQDIALVKRPDWEATIYDLLAAYGRQRQKHALSRVTIERRFVWSLAEARAALERLLGQSLDWAPLDAYFAAYVQDSSTRRSMTASAFASSLEMVRDGSVELKQEKAFAPLFMRPKPVATVPVALAAQTGQT